MIEPLSVLGASISGLSNPIASAISGEASSIAGAVQDFGQVMAQVSGNAVDVLKTAEATSMAGLQGTATVQDVVEAVMSAERTLQTAIAVRDKIVSAYQDITRMAI